MSIKDNLEKFVRHVEELSKHVNDKGEDGFDKEFQQLRQISFAYRSNPTYKSSHGESEENRRKNRFKDILPFDSSRVTLKGIEGLTGSDYINANFVKGATGSPSYIASQGPMIDTVIDFWLMNWKYEIKVIFMVCKEKEKGKVKCERYWPDTKSGDKSYGQFRISLIEEKHISSDFVIRTLRVKKNCKKEVKEKTMFQYHYDAWPDHGIPKSVLPILDMIALARDNHPSYEQPMVVHCSAGCGRTGTICAIDYSWSLLKSGKLQKDFSLYNVIGDMRKQRTAMVQTKDQYLLAHTAVAELFNRHIEIIDKHAYENVHVQQTLSPDDISYENSKTQLTSTAAELENPYEIVSPTEPNPHSDKRKRLQKPVYENVDAASFGQKTSANTEEEIHPSIVTIDRTVKALSKQGVSSDTMDTLYNIPPSFSRPLLKKTTSLPGEEKEEHVDVHRTATPPLKPALMSKTKAVDSITQKLGHSVDQSNVNTHPKVDTVKSKTMPGKRYSNDEKGSTYDVSPSHRKAASAEGHHLMLPVKSTKPDGVQKSISVEGIKATLEKNLQKKSPDLKQGNDNYEVPPSPKKLHSSIEAIKINFEKEQRKKDTETTEVPHPHEPNKHHVSDIAKTLEKSKLSLTAGEMRVRSSSIGKKDATETAVKPTEEKNFWSKFGGKKLGLKKSPDANSDKSTNSKSGNILTGSDKKQSDTLLVVSKRKSSDDDGGAKSMVKELAQKGRELGKVSAHIHDETDSGKEAQNVTVIQIGEAGVSSISDVKKTVSDNSGTFKSYVNDDANTQRKTSLMSKEEWSPKAVGQQQGSDSFLFADSKSDHLEAPNEVIVSGNGTCISSISVRPAMQLPLTPENGAHSGAGAGAYAEVKDDHTSSFYAYADSDKHGKWSLTNLEKKKAARVEHEEGKKQILAALSSPTAPPRRKSRGSPNNITEYSEAYERFATSEGNDSPAQYAEFKSNPNSPKASKSKSVDIVVSSPSSPPPVPLKSENAFKDVEEKKIKTPPPPIPTKTPQAYMEDEQRKISGGAITAALKGIKLKVTGNSSTNTGVTTINKTVETIGFGLTHNTQKISYGNTVMSYPNRIQTNPKGERSQPLTWKTKL